MQKQLEAGTLRYFRATRADRITLRNTVTARRIRVALPFAEGSDEIAAYGEKQQSRRLLSQQLVDQINWLGGHSGTSLVVRNLFDVPFWFDSEARRDIKSAPESISHARRAALTITMLLGAVGYRPIVEKWEEHPATLVLAKGREHDVTEYTLCRFKLPQEASTCHPNRPLGPSIFGHDKGGQLDTICPDIVAFIMIEKSDTRTNLGPYVFSVDQIEKELDDRTKSHLRETHYRIDPDPTLTRASDNGFGGVSKINVLGERGSAQKPDGRKYMRFVLDRLKDEQGHDAPIVALRTAIEKLEKAQQNQPIDMSRGDVLLVNNRRVATRWTRIAYESKLLQSPQTVTLAGGDRTVLRMCFYSHKEIPPEGGTPEIGATAQSTVLSTEYPEPSPPALEAADESLAVTIEAN